MKLDSKTVAGLRLADGKTDAVFWDDKVVGFGLRVRRSGDEIKRSYVYQYRHNGRSRRYFIGKVEEITAAQAREQAEKQRAKVRLGHDPQQEKEDKRLKATPLALRAIVQNYLDSKKGEIRRRSFVEFSRYLTSPRYFQPLHQVDINSITRKDIAACVNRIAKEGGRVAAGRARATLSSFFQWCMTQGLAEHNPCIGTVAPKQPAPRERVLDDAELVRIWKACGDDDYSRVIKLLVLTACRRLEVGGMCWSEINQGTWTLPSTRSKNGREHALPVTSLMREIIEAVPHVHGRDNLFGAKADSGFSQWATNKRWLDERLGEMKAWRLHDIRRSVATGMADIGIAPHIIETILNHKSGHKSGVAGIYNRARYYHEVTIAMQRWSDHIIAVITGAKPKVLAFEQRATVSA
jgi:integrase